ncbi:MAG: redox-regulated ATPase YchF [Clostridiales bacterium]|jgi:GTP-binding protein YchF|nr:redox-regulated ATPase YchF [Clostridiales bacterium]
MELGIIGLPNVGKSTLFNAITKSSVQSANYPFCTIEPNIGVVNVPDIRLEELSKIYNPEKITPAVANFVDIAGLVKGASVGEGLGNKFLSNIREVDAIVHVVRCFRDENIFHVENSVDPIRDIEIVNLELIFSDIDIVEKRISKLDKNFKINEENRKFELDTLNKIKVFLESGKMARNLNLSQKEIEIVSNVNLITLKPVIYAANSTEGDYTNPGKNDFLKKVQEYSEKNESEMIVISAKIEEELSSLSDEEKKIFLEDIGASDTGLNSFIKKSYDLLELISYFTAGKPEVRAWTITNNTKAPAAAGKIHSDFERGFIRAEVIGFDDFLECGSLSNAKSKGLIRSEGKEYVVHDGDIIHFLFNV